MYRLFPREIRMAKVYKRGEVSSLVIRERQSKGMRCHITPAN